MTLDAESNSDLGTTFNFHAKRGLANSIFLILLKFIHNRQPIMDSDDGNYLIKYPFIV